MKFIELASYIFSIQNVTSALLTLQSYIRSYLKQGLNGDGLA